ncbi:MAG: ABC transporter ATP-binding protein [Clostridia bacterium]|jgi:peptide/nickel transport system ATP-binding protein|nr:ABC transporter ATP-binding protein [Clostridia bacterium]
MQLNKDIVLKLENLQTKFKVGKRIVHAVNDVSFELKSGTTLGVVGESGCGKSVTAHSVIQLLPKNGMITKGSVTYRSKAGELMELSSYKRNGKDIRQIRGQEIAMIFQDPMASLDPVYKIGSQIAENLLEHEKISKKEARARVVKLLDELGIPEPDKRYDDYPHQFSGGMKQRVMIATAMICNPNILIADEPTTALDVTIQAQILQLMNEVQKEHGTSIIMITHNMGIIAETCDEVAVMYMGKIVEFGLIEQVFNDSKHPYTKALLKSVPVLGLGKGTKLESIRGTTPDASDAYEGCVFEPRCDSAMAICKSVEPGETCLADAHCVRCHLYEGGSK